MIHSHFLSKWEENLSAPACGADAGYLIGMGTAANCVCVQFVFNYKMKVWHLREQGWDRHKIVEMSTESLFPFLYTLLLTEGGPVKANTGSRHVYLHRHTCVYQTTLREGSFWIIQSKRKEVQCSS